MKTVTYSIRHAMVACLNLCLLAWLAGHAPEASAQDTPAGITGQWEVVQEFGERKTYSELEVKEADGAYSATWNGQPLSDVKYEDSKLSFVRKMSFGGNEIEIDFKGTLKDGKIDGQTSSDWGETPAMVHRVAEPSPALGTWMMKSMFGEREINQKLVISRNDAGELTAVMSRIRREGEGPGFGNRQGGQGGGDEANANSDRPRGNANRQWELSDVKFDDGKLSFVRKMNFNDQEFVSNFSGTVEGNAIKGTMTSQRGENELNGERMGADFIGTWDLEGDFQFGGTTRKLKIMPDLNARYQMFDGLSDVGAAEIEDGTIKLTWEAGWGENRFEQSFSGKIEDGKLVGKISSAQGETAVTGKKAS